MAHNPIMKQVKASAGSGKTYALKEQFLARLAGCGQEPREEACGLRGDTTPDWRGIMAITFTNAAATEMVERVLEQLKNDALAGDEDRARVARAWIDRIIHDMGSLNISTIDSLLNLILRMAALGRGLPPDFTPVFDAEDILEPCLESIMDRAWQGDSALQRVIEEVCDDNVRYGDKKGFLASNVLYDRLKEIFPLRMRDELNNLTDLNLLLDEARPGVGLLPALRRDIHTLCDTIRLFGVKGNPCSISMHKNFLNALDKTRRYFAQEFGEAFDENLPAAKHSIVEYAATKPDTKTLFSSAYLQLGHDFPATGKSKGIVPGEIMAMFNQLQRAVADARLLELMYAQGRRHNALLRLTDAVVKEYTRDVWQSGMVLNDTIPILVRDILESDGGVPEALCRLGVRLRHFLIDEFQDTSREHWRALRPLLIEALSTGGSLTWVGDVKQAIYGFRGGDSELFDDIAKDTGLTDIIGGENMVTKDSLKQNWRSRAEIIDFNNALFSPLAIRDNALAAVSAFLEEKVEAPLSKVVTCSEVPSLLDRGGAAPAPGTTLLSHFAGLVAKAYEGVEQQYSARTTRGGAVRILTLVRSPSPSDREDEMDEEDGKTDEGLDMPLNAAILNAVRLEAASRRASRLDARWDRILVLVRTNALATSAARALSRAGIPVITENSLLLGEHPLVVQTLALLRFLRAPENDIAFWTFVTGSITHRKLTPAGRSLLDDLLLGLSRDPVRGQREGVPRKPLWEVWRQRYPEAYRILLASLMERIGAMTPYDIVAEWYERERVFERFHDAAPFLRRFLELLDTCQHREIRSLSAFLDYWDRHGGEEKVPMPKGMNAVRIMTAHAAKGLQAPVVIVGWLPPKRMTTSIGVMEYRPRYCATDKPVRALCQKDKLFPSQVAARLRDAFETINCLYVACTRPEERLYLIQQDGGPRESAVLRTLLSRAAGTLGIEEEDARVLENELAALAAAPSPAPAEASRDQDSTRGANETAGDAPWLHSCGGSDQRHGGDLWQPMAWAPKLKVRFAYQRESSPRDIAIDQGIFMHSCMEELSALPRRARVPAIIVERQFQRRPWLRTEGFREQALSELTWFLSQPEAHDWLDNGLSEQSMVFPATTGGNQGPMRTLRVDLLVPGAKSTLVLDYKHGDPSPAVRREYECKMREYLSCLADCGQPSPRGIILYLSSRERHKILPKRKARPARKRAGTGGAS